MTAIAHRPTGTVAARPTGTASVRTPGTVAARLAGTVAARPTGTIAARPTGTVASRPTGTVAARLAESAERPVGGGTGRSTRPVPHRRAALLRCALYLGPCGVAVTAADILARVPWQVTVGVLLVGWSGAQALRYAGTALRRRAGAVPAARLVSVGFLALTGLWLIAVAVAPAQVVGRDRVLAAWVGLTGIAAFAAVTGALVGRLETPVIRWSIPVWLLAATAAAGGWPSIVPIEAALAAAVAIVAARALWPALRRSPEDAAPARLGELDLRRTTGHLLLGLAQAASAVWLCRAGPDGVTAAAVLPLVAAVPMAETFAGWHAAQVSAGLDRHDTLRGYARHLRGLAGVTVLGLLPPLGIGVALAAAADRLPYDLSAHAPIRHLVLALAAGTLLGGVFAATLLLAGHGRLGRAVLVAAAGPIAGAAAAATDLADALTCAVGALAITGVTAVAAVAHSALDHRVLDHRVLDHRALDHRRIA